MRTIFAVMTIALTLAVQSAAAQTNLPAPPAATAPSGAAPMVDGEVRKVDKEAGKITIRHDPIPNLEMPSMTMVFRVTDPAMLDKVKAGDRIRFMADKVGGAYTVTGIEPAK